MSVCCYAAGGCDVKVHLHDACNVYEHTDAPSRAMPRAALQQAAQRCCDLHASTHAAAGGATPTLQLQLQHARTDDQAAVATSAHAG